MVSRSTWMTTKIKWSRHRSFLYGCDRSPGVNVLKLGIRIPNLKQHNWYIKIGLRILKSGSSIMCEEGLAPTQRPFENDTN